MQRENNRKEFDMMLGQYCGPALAGIKPANMICIKKYKLPLFKSLLAEYNNNMNKHDIYFSIVNETDTCYLMMVYRKNKLSKRLQDPEVAKILRNYGYQDSFDLDCYVEHLTENFKKESKLPDEIGLFLGYPVEDVIGFKENNGRNYLISKYWKVYNNVNEAQMIFDKYDKCKSALCKHLQKGTTILDMFTKVVA